LNALQGLKTKALAKAQAPAKPRKISQKEQRELATIEPEIAALEQAIAALETQLNEPSFYIDHAAEAPALLAQVEDKKAQLETKLNRWAELEEIKEASEA
jgi:ATP-binding cassette subfamily F protein uup